MKLHWVLLAVTCALVKGEWGVDVSRPGCQLHLPLGAPTQPFFNLTFEAWSSNATTVLFELQWEGVAAHGMRLTLAPPRISVQTDHQVIYTDAWRTWQWSWNQTHWHLTPQPPSTLSWAFPRPLPTTYFTAVIPRSAQPLWITTGGTANSLRSWLNAPRRCRLLRIPSPALP